MKSWGWVDAPAALRVLSVLVAVAVVFARLDAGAIVDLARRVGRAFLKVSRGCNLGNGVGSRRHGETDEFA